MMLITVENVANVEAVEEITTFVAQNIFETDHDINIVVAGDDDLAPGLFGLIIDQRNTEDDEDFVVFVNNHHEDDFVEIIAHEFTHVRQLVGGELIYGVETNYWHGERYDHPETDDDYYNQPFEVEARAEGERVANLWNE